MTSTAPHQTSSTQDGGTDGLSRTLEVVNPRGLHARPSGKLAECAQSFDATVTVCKVSTGEQVTACSIMGLLMLAASKGDSLTLTATGPDAAAALETLSGMIADGFGEDH